MTARKLISESKKALANDGDEEAKHDITMEEMEAKAEHKVAIREAMKLFNDLTDEEKESAKTQFEKISGKGNLTIDEALEFAEMAKFYATRNRKPAVDKDKVIAQKANTGIAPRGNGKQEQLADESEMRQKLLHSGIPQWQVDLMYPTK